MRFDLTGDEREIQRTARDLLGERSPFARVRAQVEAARDADPGAAFAAAADGDGPVGGYDDVAAEDTALWGELRDLGWPGIATSEEHGGGGFGLVALCVLSEELGRAVAPVPFLGTALAAQLVEHGGSEEQREDWLGHLASGELRGAVTLTGDATPVPGAAEGGLLVVCDAAGGPAVVHGPGSGIVEPCEAIDPTRGHGRVPIGALDAEDELDGRGDWLGGTPTPAGDALDRATIVVAAELVGVVQRALELTVAYVKDRRQFGVPVGSFQAVQHAAAQMLRDVEVARVTTYNAAWVADAGDAASMSLAEAAAMAKATASDAGRAVTAAATQLHGGIGFTWEADVHWLLKRAQVDAALLGAGGHHRARLARLLGERSRGGVAAD